MRTKTLAFLALTAGTATSALADTIHVAMCGNDAWTGASPVCAAPDGPKRTIQAGIDASSHGDTVLVADGEYTGPGNRDMDYGGRAIILRGSGGAKSCIINCEGSAAEPHRAFHFQGGESTTSVLEGFTIRNAFEPTDIGFGGAIICQFGAPLIQDCVFSNNRTYVGGAIYVGAAGGVLSHCLFEDNLATQTGGAVAVDGAATTFTKCTFIRNTTTNPGGGGGGGVVCSEAFVTFDGCVFTKNTGGRIGGGLWATDCQIALTDCTFMENSATARASGCGLSSNTAATLVNCLFTSNAGAPGVAACWVGNGLGDPTFATMLNCTFSRNGSSFDTGLAVTQTSALDAVNCVYWDNALPIVADPGTFVTISHSNIQGGWAGLGNKDEDPLFVNPGAGNFRLSAYSPCIDAGDNTVLPTWITLNLDGLPRFSDDPWTPDTGVAGGAGGSVIVDMGAYEFQGASCPADLNADGLVDFSDYLEFLNLFDAGDLRVDFNHDGIVDFTDYLEFLNLFDAGC